MFTKTSLLGSCGCPNHLIDLRIAVLLLGGHVNAAPFLHVGFAEPEIDKEEFSTGQNIPTNYSPPVR